MHVNGGTKAVTAYSSGKQWPQNKQPPVRVLLMSANNLTFYAKMAEWKSVRSKAYPVTGLPARCCDHSELRPQPIGNSAGDLWRRLVRDREHRTDVDLAKHVTVGPVGAGWAEHEVRVPDHRQVAPRDVQQGGQLRRPLVFHQPAQDLVARVGIEGIEPPSGLGTG